VGQWASGRCFVPDGDVDSSPGALAPGTAAERKFSPEWAVEDVLQGGNGQELLFGEHGRRVVD